MKKNIAYLVGAKNVFTISLIVIVLTILGVFFWGLGRHSTFYENSMISTTILSVAFFLFVSVGLYRGIKLNDDMPALDYKYEPEDIFSTHHPGTPASMDLDIDGDDGCLGVIFAILLWIIAAIFFSVVLWIFGQVIVVAVLTFFAMLYWIFLRALRLVFNNSNQSKGDLFASVKLGLMYTLLYNFWIYGILMLTHYLKF